jgi:hypothetical protein
MQWCAASFSIISVWQRHSRCIIWFPQKHKSKMPIISCHSFGTMEGKNTRLFCCRMIGVDPPPPHTAIRKFKTNIPKKGITRPQSQFPHSCVCERFIYSHDRSAYPAAGNMWTETWEYINRSQTNECGNWGWGRAIPRKGIHIWDFRCSAACTYSTVCTATKLRFVFLFWELRSLSPNFHIHVSVRDLYIPRIGPLIFLQQNR